MKIVFTNHAITRLLERGIDPWKAKEVVKSPLWKKRQEDGSLIARRDFEGKIIEVVYVLRGKDCIIKTAYLCE